MIMISIQDILVYKVTKLLTNCQRRQLFHPIRYQRNLLLFPSSFLKRKLKLLTAKQVGNPHRTQEPRTDSYYALCPKVTFHSTPQQFTNFWNHTGTFSFQCFKNWEINLLIFLVLASLQYIFEWIFRISFTHLHFKCLTYFYCILLVQQCIIV